MALLDDHSSRGARALILLHDRELRDCNATWRQARAAKIVLPKDDDPDYASLDHVAYHVLACARGYMVWCCEVLQLPEPAIEACPAVEHIGDEAERYLEHVLAGWRGPLAKVTDEMLNSSHASRWGVTYCIDAMLEHAVMHPARHRFQLTERLTLS
ncbi:MAG: hypothetical protein ACI9EF_001176 [Pseudohongiellaceae bacterium]|jgi:hypothetical protein